MSKWIAAGRTIAGGITTPTIVQTTDGINWTTVTTSGLPLRGQVDAVHFGDDLFLATISGATISTENGIYKSADGITWVQVNTSQGTVEFAWGEDIWARIQQSNASISFNDGTTWTTAPFTLTNANRIAYGSGRFLVFARSSGSTIALRRYTIGTGWDLVNISGPRGGNFSVTGLEYNNNRWVGIITYSTGPASVYSMVSLDNGNTWTFNLINTATASGGLAYGKTPGGPRVWVTGVAVGATIFTAYSTDLVTWTLGTNPFPTQVIGAVNYANSVFFVSQSTVTGQLARSSSNPPSFSLVAGSPLMTTIFGLSDTFPREDDPFTDIEALGNNGHTVYQPSYIYASLLYRGPLVNAENALTLYTVQKDYRYDSATELVPVSPKVSDDGLPFYTDVYPVGGDPEDDEFSTRPGQVPYHSETISPWGKIGILINNEDVTFFRDAPTIIESISWQTFGNFETLSLYFPHITVYDKLGLATPTTSSGTGGGVIASSIPWLNDSNNVEIRRLKPDNTEETLWIGSINGLELDPSGYGVRLTCSGLLYDTNHQLIPGAFREVEFVAPEDVGIITANTLNSLSGRWTYAEPATVGVETIKIGNWDNALDFLRALNTFGTPKLWFDTNATPFVTGRPDMNEFDLVAGQEGVELNLAYDSNAIPTHIYGTGTIPSGAAWRNVIYPRMTGDDAQYRWPFDDVNATLSKGMRNRDTINNNGLTALGFMLQDKALISPFAPPLTRFSNSVQGFVEQLQEIYEQEVTGDVDIELWNNLVSDTRGVGNSVGNAYIAPLYVSPLVDPTSPSYDPNVKKVEQFIDFGGDITLEEGIAVAESIVLRDLIRVNTGEPAVYRPRKSVTGNITLTVCPATISRWDIKPGDRVKVWTHLFAPIPKDTHNTVEGFTQEAGEWGGSVVLYVSRVDWSFNGTPTVTLEVSSRDLEYSELEAAKNRTRVSNAQASEITRIKKAITKPNN